MVLKVLSSQLKHFFFFFAFTLADNWKFVEEYEETTLIGYRQKFFTLDAKKWLKC